jgi:hypothetical protein
MHLVSTFSFIGESDPEREATLRRDLAGPLLTADALADLVGRNEGVEEA